MHNKLVLDVYWLDEMKIEGCQRESLAQSMGTMSFAVKGIQCIVSLL